MAQSLNRTSLIGNIGSIYTRTMPSGDAVTNVSLATTESWRDRETGEMKERTEWHRLSFKNRGNYHLGRIASEALNKGDKIFAEGSNRTREWEKDGIKRYTTEIEIAEFQVLVSKKNDESPQQAAPQQSYTAPQQAAPQQAAPQGFNTPQGQAPQPQSFGSWGDAPNQ